jgi:photosystem II stability/assembly factor-like uncharacterized protein
MISATIGWAEALLPPTTPGPVVARLILRTTDGGQHWRDVTPPGLTPQVQGGVPTEYLDQDNAWVMGLLAPGQIGVMRTTDAGTHWQESVIRDANVQYQLSNTGSAQLRFVDANHGWLFVSYGHNGDEAGALYRTVDGGRQWSVVSKTDPNKGSGTAIPWQGFKTGITFVDQKDGWLTATAFSTKPLLYVTRDAGMSWNPVPYPDLPAVDLAGGHAVTRPRFFSPTSGVFEVLAGHSVVYTTTDSGASWRPSVSPGCCEFYFLNANEGWALALDDNHPASAHIDAQTPNEVSGHYVTRIAEPDFVTSEIGYVLRSSGQPVLLAGPTPTPNAHWSQSLLTTTDGGATWTKVWSVEF